MRKELIRSKEENERLKQVVINNRLKQFQCNKSVVSLGDCNSSLNTNNTINTSAEELREQIRDIENYVTNNIFTESNEESPELPVNPVFRELIDYKGLNQLECNRMRELMIASNVFNYRLNSEKIVKEILGLEKMIANYSHLNEKFVTDLISFAQHLMTFNTICPKDGLALVKYGGKDLMLIRILKYYHQDRA
ncbi:unnamed protein product, partial [Medioppia subpectinata]